jgi:hypothetical protein
MVGACGDAAIENTRTRGNQNWQFVDAASSFWASEFEQVHTTLVEADLTLIREAEITSR